MDAAFEDQLVGLARRLFAPPGALAAGLAARRHLARERPGDGMRDLVLDAEQVVERGVDLRPPECLPIRHREQSHADAQAVALALERPLDDSVDLQLPPPLARGRDGP